MTPEERREVERALAMIIRNLEVVAPPRDDADQV
jgi:hypothetical protein